MTSKVLFSILVGVAISAPITTHKHSKTVEPHSLFGCLIPQNSNAHGISKSSLNAPHQPSFKGNKNAQFSSSSYGSDTGSTGYGQHSESHAGPAQYTFTYDVLDSYTGNKFGHSEQRNGYETEGTYYVLLPDTRLQKVQYYVDQYGYHPTITYEGDAQYPSPQTYKSNALKYY